MVTISPIRTKLTFWASIRGKILLAFLVIVGVSFAVAATNLSGLVSDYLFEQRTKEDEMITEKLASAAASPFQRVNPEEISRVIEENSASVNGRIMLLDMDGKVQYDSFNVMCGCRLKLDEVSRVIAGGEKKAYGTHTPGRAEVERMSGEQNADHLAYSVYAMESQDGRVGAVLYVSRIQSMMDSLYSVRMQLISVFLVIALAAMALAMILSQVLTKPITSLSRTMRKMGRGDLSVRAPVSGSGELRELAENYNTMAAQLESLDRTRSQFVSNASHELKTPLATMKIMLETLIYQPDMPADLRQEFMSDMNHEIDRLTRIITDLLTLTSMDNDETRLSAETVDMSVLTEETVRQLQPAAESHSQTMKTEIEPGVTILGDRIKLNQILYNLMDNAIKYTPDGGEIGVSLAMGEEMAVWRVRDNGVGIPREDQEHIFERFYRVDKARSRETGGTGLGLSIVRQLVNFEGGTVTVESSPGKGSVFTVRLPREGAASV